jgi:L-fuconolactonase
MRIDTHQHFWRRSRGDYTWLDPAQASLRPLLRDFEPHDLLPLLNEHDVSQTVLVQAAASEAETDFLLALSDQHAWIAGVVGWIDLSDPTRRPVLNRWARHPKFKGVRPMLQDIEDVDWIAHAPHPTMAQALIDHGLRMDALVKPQHLAGLLRFIDRWPRLNIVVDHAAKPLLRAGWQADWAATWRVGMRDIAAHPHVQCKFSALLTEADPATIADPQAATRTVRPVWDVLVEQFGPGRLMWGSDWPVLTLASSYARWVSVCEALIGSLDSTEQAAVWHGNAARFYALPAIAKAAGE